jgi:hypothetical protein
MVRISKSRQRLQSSPRREPAIVFDFETAFMVDLRCFAHIRSLTNSAHFAGDFRGFRCGTCGLCRRSVAIATHEPEAKVGIATFVTAVTSSGKATR